MMYDEESTLWRIWKVRLITFTFLITIVCLTVMPLWQKIGIQPILFLIILYHWTLYRSDLMPIEQLVLISLIQDGIYAYPLGFSALRLLIGYTLLTTQRRILSHQRFLWVWGGFGIFTLIDGLIYAALLSCVKHEWVGILPLTPGFAMTVGLYPLTIWIMNRYVIKRLPV
jgi:cell shape-determining protein MreD